MVRKWLITGVSSGLGNALANEVMRNGDFVYGTFRKQEQVDEFGDVNTGKGKGVLLDVTNPEQIKDAFDSVEDLDVLVNNAGFGFVGAVEEASLDEIRNVMEANFFGVVEMTKYALKILRKKRSGHIIQISSHAGIKAFPGFGVYNAAKFALEGASEAMADEVRPLGIKLSIVEPGPFRTGFAGSSIFIAEEKIEDYKDTAGSFREKIKLVNGKQEGDPNKAAKAIWDLANSPDPPLRLPLGKTALNTIGMKIESVKKDLENGKTIAENTVFD